MGRLREPKWRRSRAIAPVACDVDDALSCERPDVAAESVEAQENATDRHFRYVASTGARGNRCISGVGHGSGIRVGIISCRCAGPTKRPANDAYRDRVRSEAQLCPGRVR